MLQSHSWKKQCSSPQSVWSPIKGTAMQIKKALINDRLNVSKVSWKFHNPTVYNIRIIYPGNLLFS